MGLKNQIPRLYRTDALSLCAWAWIEAILYSQKEILENGKELSIMDAARLFQSFFGLEEDDLGLYHIRQCYYRTQEKNRTRKDDEKTFPAYHSSKEIAEKLDEINHLLTKILQHDGAEKEVL